MYQPFALVLLFLSVHVIVASRDHDHVLVQRNACDGIDAMPILYHDYLSDVCRPKYLTSSSGVCDHTDYQSNSCVAFCQLRTRFVYEKEFPLDVWCHGPPCKIADSTKRMTWSVDMRPEFEKGLNDGISGGWQSKITADVGPQGMSYEKPLEAGQCGYWTWVSIKRTVCGTMSYQQAKSHQCVGGMQTIKKYCVDDLRRYSDSILDGETIFVYTDCVTRLPLPMDQQSSIYRLPGIAMDRGDHSSAQSLGYYSQFSGLRQQVL